ncbi:MAG: signal peptidase I [Acidimicrobiia bacterium]|nr:signal peptidase I [Acidimicrobiia bacterium]
MVHGRLERPTGKNQSTLGSAVAFVSASVWLWSVLWLSIAGIVGPLLPNVDGWVISSSSMGPALSPGDLLITSRPAPETQYVAPTVITFRSGDKVMTHRIIESVETPSGIAYVTQGDANQDPDSAPVESDQVLGLGRVVVPFVALPVLWVQNGEFWKAALLVVGLLAAVHVVVRYPGRGKHEELDASPVEVLARVTTILVMGAALAMGPAASATFADNTSELLPVAGGADFGRPAYGVDVLSDNPAGYWRLGETAPRTTFTDDFETFAGWTDSFGGFLIGQTAIQHGGASGGVGAKTTNGDPAGAWKDIGFVTDEWRLTVWVNHVTPLTGGDLDRIGVETSSFDGYSLVVDHSANQIKVERRTGGTAIADVTPVVAWDPPEDGWYRAVLDKRSSGLVRLQVFNAAGALQATASGNDTTYSQGFNRVVVHGGFDYLIDDLAVMGFAIPQTAADSSINNNVGDYFQNVTHGQTALISDPDTSVLFAGGSVAIPTHTSINEGPRSEKSLSVWVDITDTTSRQVIWEEGGATNGFNLYVDGGFLYGMAWAASAAWSNDLITSVPISTGVRHVGLVLDAVGGTLRLYLNGVEVDIATKVDVGQLPSHIDANGIGNLNGGTRFHDGNGSGSFPFLGRIDEVAIFNTALSPTRISEHWANGTG